MNMSRICDIRSLFEKMSPLFEERLDTPTSMAIRTDAGDVYLSYEDGKINFDPKPTDNVLYIGQSILMEVLYGYITLDEALENNTVRYNGDYEVFGVLSPKKPSYLYSTDLF